jgi:ribosome-associated protein
MSAAPRVLEDGSLFIRTRLTIPSDEVTLRVTTPGGPGGQHANRSLTRVVATFDVERSRALGPADRALLAERLGPVVRSSASRFRSQGQNRAAALEQLAQRIATGLTRVDEKKARGRVKQQRRTPTDE